MMLDSEMNLELNKKFGVQLNDSSATVAETSDIYDAYVNAPGNIHNHQLSLVRKVKYPLFNSKSLDCNSDKDAKDCPYHQDQKKFKLINGGHFISDSSFLKDEEIPEMLELFASFLDVDPTKHAHENASDIGAFGYLPNII